MKKILFITLVGCAFVTGCTTSKNTGHPKANTMTVNDRLNGSWELTFISGSKPFEKLYAKRKPTIVFDTKKNMVNGNSSCNSYFGSFMLNGNQISFSETMGMTKMFCEGDGESEFMSRLKTVKSYIINEQGNELKLVSDERMVSLSFRKKAE